MGMRWAYWLHAQRKVLWKYQYNDQSSNMLVLALNSLYYFLKIEKAAKKILWEFIFPLVKFS